MNMAPTFDTEGNTITILSKNSHLRKAILQLLGYASCHSSAYIRLMLGMSSVRWIRGTLHHSMCLSRILLLHEYSSGLWNYIWRIRLLPTAALFPNCLKQSVKEKGLLRWQHHASCFLLHFLRVASPHQTFFGIFWRFSLEMTEPPECL